MRALILLLFAALLTVAADAQPLRLGMTRDSLLALVQRNNATIITDRVGMSGSVRSGKTFEVFERLRVSPYALYGADGLATILIGSTGKVEHFNWTGGIGWNGFDADGFQRFDSIYWIPAPGDFEEMVEHLNEVYGEAEITLDGYHMDASWIGGEGERAAFLTYDESHLSFVGVLDTARPDAGKQPDPTIPPVVIRPVIYDAMADGNRQISEGLEQAWKERKNLLVQFGSNNCLSCYELNRLLANDREIADTLLHNYIVVLVDINPNQRHNLGVIESYFTPVEPDLPATVVLSREGSILTTILPTDLVARGEFNRGILLELLTRWAPR